MDLAFLNEYVVTMVLAFCLGIGFVIKQFADFIPNKYIPLIMAVSGVLFNMYLNDYSVEPAVIVAGIISGLSSTGMYELFRNFIEKK